VINIFDLRKLGKCFLFLVFVLHSATEQDRKPWRPWEYCDEDLQSQFQGVIHPNEGAVLAPLPRPTLAPLPRPTFGLPPTLAPLPRPTFGLPPTLAPLSRPMFVFPTLALLPTPMPEPFSTLDPFPDCLAHYPYMNQSKRVEWYESIKIIKAQGYDESNDLYKALLADLINMQQREYWFDAERKKGGVPNANRVLRSVLLDRILAEKSSLLQDDPKLAKLDRILAEKARLCKNNPQFQKKEQAEEAKQDVTPENQALLEDYKRLIEKEKQELTEKNKQKLDHYMVLVEAVEAEDNRRETIRAKDRERDKTRRDKERLRAKAGRLKRNKPPGGSEKEVSSIASTPADPADVEIDKDGAPTTFSAEALLNEECAIPKHKKLRNLPSQK